jgi:hypothetical protein
MTNIVLTGQRWVDDLSELLALSQQASVIITMDGGSV